MPGSAWATAVVTSAAPHRPSLSQAPCLSLPASSVFPPGTAQGAGSGSSCALTQPCPVSSSPCLSPCLGCSPPVCGRTHWPCQALGFFCPEAKTPCPFLTLGEAVSLASCRKSYGCARGGGQHTCPSLHARLPWILSSVSKCQ